MRAILFDLDGTLLDTLEDLADSGNRVLLQRGFSEHPIEAYRLFVGEGVRTLIERILPPAHRDPHTVKSALAAFRSDYGQNWKNKTKPYEGILELLSCPSTSGFKLGVLSNKPDSMTKQCVGSFFDLAWFSCIRGQQEHVPPKPDPQGAIDMAHILKMAPGDFYFVGDSRIDMETAVRARMHPLGVLWGFRSRDELLASGAEEVFVHPGQLSSFLLGSSSRH